MLQTSLLLNILISVKWVNKLARNSKAPDRRLRNWLSFTSPTLVKVLISCLIVKPRSMSSRETWLALSVKPIFNSLYVVFTFSIMSLLKKRLLKLQRKLLSASVVNGTIRLSIWNVTENWFKDISNFFKKNPATSKVLFDQHSWPESQLVFCSDFPSPGCFNLGNVFQKLTT